MNILRTKVSTDLWFAPLERARWSESKFIPRENAVPNFHKNLYGAIKKATNYSSKCTEFSHTLLYKLSHEWFVA